MKRPNVTCAAFKDGRRCAVTISFDDGYDLSSALFFEEQMKTYGMRATANLTVNFVRGKEEEWKKIFSRGVIDMANHGLCHSYRYDDPAKEAESLNDIEEGYRQLTEMFPGIPLYTYVTPFGPISDATEAKIAEHHVACRLNEDAGDPINDPDTVCDHPFRIPSIPALNTTETEELNAYVDEAKKRGGWFVEMYHQYAPEGTEAGRIFVREKVARAHFKYIGEDDEIWCPSFNEAIRYFYERKHLSVAITGMGESSVRIDARTDLLSPFFDGPVTLLIEKPEKSKNYRVNVKPVYETDDVIAVNVVPGKDSIIMEEK